MGLGKKGETGTNQKEGTSSGDGRRQAKKRILGRSVPGLRAERERGTIDRI